MKTLLVFLSLTLFLPLSSIFALYPPSGGVSRYINLISTGLFQASLSAFVALVGGLIISHALARRRINEWLRRFVSALSKVSFVTPGVSMAIGFLLIFGKKGILNLLLKPFGIHVDILYTLTAVVLGHAFYNIPVVVYITGTTWEKLDGEVLEAAMMDGASEWRAFLRVELPLLLPSMLSSYLMAFLYSFTSFAVVMTIGGFRYRTLEVAIYSAVSRLNFSKATALTILQLVIVSLSAALANILRSTDFPAGKPLKKKMKPVEVVVFTVSLAVVVLPLAASLIWGLVDRNGFRLLVERGWDFIGSGFSDLLKNTFFVSVLASIISTVVGLVSSRAANKGCKICSVFAAVPTAVSTAVLAFGYLSLVLRIGVRGISLVALAVLHSVISLPMVHRILESGWNSVKREVEEASMVDGAGMFARFTRVYLPLMAPAVLRSLTLSMAISMGELAAVLILAGGEFMTLSSAVYRLMSGRHLPEAMALNSLFLAMVMGIFSLGEIVGSRSEE